jgi:hypothetical protein
MRAIVLAFLISGCGWVSGKHGISMRAEHAARVPTQQIDQAVDVLVETLSERGLIDRDFALWGIRRGNWALHFRDEPIEFCHGERPEGGRFFYGCRDSNGNMEIFTFTSCFAKTEFTHELTHEIIGFATAGVPIISHGRVIMGRDEDSGHTDKPDWWEAERAARHKLTEQFCPE